MDWHKKININKDQSHFYTNFDWLERMNKAIEYIENNLNNKIDYNKVLFCL